MPAFLATQPECEHLYQTSAAFNQKTVEDFVLRQVWWWSWRVAAAFGRVCSYQSTGRCGASPPKKAPASATPMRWRWRGGSLSVMVSTSAETPGIGVVRVADGVEDGLIRGLVPQPPNGGVDHSNKGL